jgi:hypothetical protein
MLQLSTTNLGATAEYVYTRSQPSTQFSIQEALRLGETFSPAGPSLPGCSLGLATRLTYEFTKATQISCWPAPCVPTFKSVGYFYVPNSIHLL